MPLDSTRWEAVREAAARWADELVDMGPYNPLLHTREGRGTALDLGAARPEAMSMLLAGRKVRLSALFAGDEVLKSACSRARTLRKKIVALDEEQGVEACRLALGLVRVPAARGLRPVAALRAPLLLQPIELLARSGAETDFTLEVSDQPVVNPVLLYALHHGHGVDLDADEIGEKVDALLSETPDPAEQARLAHACLAAVLEPAQIAIELEERVLISVYSYEKLPMVADLRASTGLLTDHDVIAAIAGHAPAKLALAASAPVSAPAGDSVAPQEEFLVLDADSSQHAAIARVLAGAHALIDGPPGTGKSQTIANLIAELAARGKSVLFVTEKRAAIEAVTQRLEDVELHHLVFDLHDRQSRRRRVAQQLAESLDRAAQEPPPRVDAMHRKLSGLRDAVAAHPRELHELREPWGISYFEAQCRLAALPPDAAVGARFRGPVLRALGERTVENLLIELRSYVDQDGFRVRRGDTCWSGSGISTVDDVEGVLVRLDRMTTTTLTSTQDRLQALVADVGLRPPDTVAGWREIFTLLNEVAATLRWVHPDIFKADLEVLLLATAPWSVRRRSPHRLGFWQRRALVRQVKDLTVDGWSWQLADLHEVLTRAVEHKTMWATHSADGRSPTVAEGLHEAIQSYEHLCEELAAIAMTTRIERLEDRTPDEIEVTLGTLGADREILYRMPDLAAMARRFSALGLDSFLDELARRETNAEQAALSFQHAWLSSLLEEFRLRSQWLSRFTGPGHDRNTADFRDTDRAHRDASAQRVRRAVAENLRRTRDSHPEQSALVREQAARKIRHLPVRTLITRAPDVLLAARPCWAMSPIVVSRMLPAQQLFDVVIFDEASQVEPRDAIASIMRGRQLVVAGDQLQLPPTRYFDSVLAGRADPDEDDEADLGVYDSLLDAVAGILPHRTRLLWHYRSTDERLIAFSNAHIYGDTLVSFPGVRQDSPVALDVVADAVAVPGQRGSSPQESLRVRDLVVEHARTRPHESLGVIAMNERHAMRIEAAIRAAAAEDSALDEFLSPDAGPGRRFFVKSLENVQGDERDAIILTVGYPRRADGRVDLKFGMLTHSGGERRLNVAATRARVRMTVVSSFSHHDLDPNATATAKHGGPELLRKFLEFAASGGTSTARSAAVPKLNPFEQAVFDALTLRGVPVHPQWGVGEHRLDFALAHPTQPGRMVLAIETDGERYHASRSTRDRDRLRQEHLERLGWSFHRVWSTSWFKDPEGETDRMVEQWHAAVAATDRQNTVPGRSARRPSAQDSPATQPRPGRGPRPALPKRDRISDFTDQELFMLCSWLLSDGLQIAREDRIVEAVNELGFRRRGSLIVQRLHTAFAQAQRAMDRKEGKV